MSKTGLDFLFSIVPKLEISHFWDVSPVNHDLWWVRHWICSEDDGFYIPVGHFVFPSVSFPTDIDQLVDQHWYTKCMGAWVNLQKGNSLFKIPKNVGKVQFWVAKPRLEELDIFQAQLLVGWRWFSGDAHISRSCWETLKLWYHWEIKQSHGTVR